MNVVNCRKCGRLFNYVAGKYICPACKEALEDKFKEVKDYIREHGTATVQEICEVCEVDTMQLHTWIREERLQFSDDSPIKVPCEACGTMIGSGRFCDKCRTQLANGFSASIQKPEHKAEPAPSAKDKNSQRMRFL